MSRPSAKKSKTDPKLSPRDAQIALYILLFATIVSVYWKVFYYPLVQDDWFIVDAVDKFGPSGFLREMLSRLDATFYRPIANVYFLANLSLFGLNSLGFHVVVLALHFVNALLVRRIAVQILSDEIVGWSAAFFYATAVTIHLDTLVWMVGMYDVAGVFFSLLALTFFLSDKTLFSVLAFSAALLTKEATVFVPLAIVVLGFRGGIGKSRTAREVFRRTFPFFIVLAAFLAIRVVSLMGAIQGTSDGYTIGISVQSLLENIRVYAGWISEGVVPFLNAHRSYWSLAVFLCAVGFIYYRKSEPRRTLLYLMGWLLCAILPALILKNHAYRYYLVYTLPPTAIILSMGLRDLWQLLGFGEKRTALFFAVLLLINVGINYRYLTELEAMRFDAWTIDGSNNLLRKGLLVNMTKEFLEKERAKIPPGATLLFDWLPTMSFGTSIGPGIWLNDTTVTVYEVQRDAAGMHLLDPLHRDAVPPTPSFDKGFILTFHGIDLDMYRLSDL